MTSYQKVQEQLNKLIHDNNLNHAYLIENGDERQQFALAYQTSVNFINNKHDVASQDNAADVVYEQYRNNPNPDVFVLETENPVVKIDEVREINKKAAVAGIANGRRTVIIPNADKISEMGFNTLLKIIEEPEPDLLFFILSSHGNLILPTVLSRLQRISLTRSSHNAREWPTNNEIEDKTRELLENSFSDDELSQILNDGQKYALVEISDNFLKKILNFDKTAFIDVGINIMPATKSIELKNIFMKLLEGRMNSISLRIESQQVSNIIINFEKFKTDLNNNVSFQNGLEEFVLQIVF